MGKRKWLSFISFHWPLMCSQEQDMPIGPRQMEALQLKGVSVLLRELLLHEEPKMMAISVTQPNVSPLFISPAFIGRTAGTERQFLPCLVSWFSCIAFRHYVGALCSKKKKESFDLTKWHSCHKHWLTSGFLTRPSWKEHVRGSWVQSCLYLHQWHW